MILLGERENINNSKTEEWSVLKGSLEFRNLIFKFKNRRSEIKYVPVEPQITGF